MRHDAATTTGQILGQLERAVLGQRPTLEVALAAILAGGHVLLEDRPGVGKTVLARALGQVLGLPTGRVQGTFDLLPVDITGVHVYQPGTGSWEFRPGPVFTSILLVDELNRITPKAQSALLEAMAEDRVTADGTSRPLPSPFVVLATQNPLGEPGTHPMGSAQLDRFAVRLSLGLPDRAAEAAIVRGEAGATHLDDLDTVIDAAGLLELREEVAAVRVHDAVLGYLLDMVTAVRGADAAVWLSVRVPQTLLAVAKALSLIAGRGYVAPEDVQRALRPVMAHRLPSAVSADLCHEIAMTIPVPTTDV